MVVPPRARKLFGDATEKLIAAILQWWPKIGDYASVLNPHTVVEQADLLPRRMGALGLDANAVARFEPVTFGNLQRVCATCEWHELCQWDLRHDPIDAWSRKYCPNSAALSVLATIPWLLNEWRAPLALL
jgi:hypothetical protein